MSYKSRQQSDNIAKNCFYQADQDRSNSITIYQFYSFLKLVFQSLNIYRQVSQQQCQQLFRFYDDDRNGFLTPNQIVDIVWDVYTSDIQNDRVAIQQMLQKIVIQKYFNRSYNQFDQSNLYGRWGKTNMQGDWKNYRFNDYQMGKMKKFGYQFTRPSNNFANIGMSTNDDFQQGGFQQQQGGFQQLSGFGQQQGGFQQSGMQKGGFQQVGIQQGEFQSTNIGINMQAQQGGFINMNVGSTGFGMGGGNFINLSSNINMNNMGMGNMGGINMGNGFNNVNQGRIPSSQGGLNSGGFSGNQGGFNANQGGFNGNQSFNRNQGGFNGNQGNPYHHVNVNSQWGQQQLQMDPFGWSQIPSFGNDPNNIVLPSPSQLNQNQKMIDLNGFGQMTQYIQPQQICLVAPIRGRNLSQYQAFQAVKQLPYMLQNKGYSGTLNFKIFFSQFVNLLQQNKFKF